MYLNAKTIMTLIEDKDNLAKLAQVGVDLTVRHIFNFETGLLIKPDKDGFVQLAAGKKYAVDFNQRMEILDALVYEAKLIHRSSLYRMGGMINYQFQLDQDENICAILYAYCDIKIQIGSRLAQLIARDCGEFKSVSHTGRIDDYYLSDVSRVENGGILSIDKTILPTYTKIEPVDGVFHCENGWYSFGFSSGCNIEQGTFSRMLVNTERLSINSPIFDPGFKTDNVGTLGSVQSKNGFVDFRVGESICKMYYFKAYDSELYNGQWQNTKPDGSK